MNKLNIPTIALVLLSILPGISFGQAVPADQPEVSINADEAKVLALQYCGVPDTERAQATVATSIGTETFADPTAAHMLPFVGKPVWRVKIQNAQMSWKRGDSLALPRPPSSESRDFEVIVDAATGKLILIRSRTDTLPLDDTTNYWDVPEAEDRALAPAVFEVELSPAGVASGASLLEALSLRSMENFFYADEIEAELVTMKWTGNKKRSRFCPEDNVPVWVVTLRYLDADIDSSSAGTFIEVKGTRQLHQVIDLSTGEPRPISSVRTGTFMQSGRW